MKTVNYMNPVDRVLGGGNDVACVFEKFQAESTSKISNKGKVIDLIFTNILLNKSPKLFIP